MIGVSALKGKLEWIAPCLEQEVSIIARKALYELAATLAFMALCAPFAQSYLIWEMAGVGLISVLSNALLRACLPSSISERLCPLTFTLFNAWNPLSLLHESGHALAAKALFVCSPTISLSVNGGVTRYSAQILTALGKKLSARTSITLVTLAGPALSLIVASVCIVAGLHFKNLYPVAIGAYDCAAHAIYATLALFTSRGNTAHDFVRLRSLGIHPLAAAVSFAAVPFFCYNILRNCSSDKI